jgi:cell division septation protein DedD
MPEAVAVLPAAAGSPPQGWMLQLGAFAQQRNAARLAEELRKEGATVTVSANLGDGYCHVLVGPYAERAGASAVIEEIRQATGYTGVIVAADRPGTLTECQP